MWSSADGDQHVIRFKAAVNNTDLLKHAEVPFDTLPASHLQPAIMAHSFGVISQGEVGDFSTRACFSNPVVALSVEA